MGKLAVCVVGVVLAGCVTDEVVEEAEVEQEGVSLNGVSLNGVSLNGVSLNGVSLSGVSLSGVSISGVSVSGATIRATSTSGPPIAGTTVVGSTWIGALGNGSTLKLKIDSATRIGTTELWSYAISYQTSTGWTSMCTAVPVAGIWSSTAAYSASTTQFTFACRGASIAKCVELGYKPYKGYSNQLASCVRLLRGDFCGNGVSYTIDGTQVNVFDNVGVQKDTQLLWLREAEWGVNGARCVTNAVTTRFLERKLTVPACLLSLVSLSCGSFRTGTYLLSELSPLTLPL